MTKPRPPQHTYADLERLVGHWGSKANDKTIDGKAAALLHARYSQDLDARRKDQSRRMGEAFAKSLREQKPRTRRRIGD